MGSRALDELMARCSLELRAPARWGTPLRRTCALPCRHRPLGRRSACHHTTPSRRARPGGQERAMVIAADYPFIDILWSMIIFFSWVVWIWMMIVILTDVFRRPDIGGWAKAAWVVFLIVLPFLGALVYLIAQHKEMAERRTKDVREQQAMVDDHIRSVAATDGPATEIANAKRLLDTGAIDQAEFDQLKSRALAAG